MTEASRTTPRAISDIAFERYEAEYERVLYMEKAYEMFGHEHQRQALRAALNLAVAECSRPSGTQSETTSLERELAEAKAALLEDCEDCDHGIRGGAPCQSCGGCGRVLIADLLKATQQHVKELKGSQSAELGRSDAAMLENYAKSYDGMEQVSGAAVAYDIRHNMIPALRSRSATTETTREEPNG